MTYAVIFKTHIWDPTVAELYRLLCSKVKNGQVFVVVDDDNSHFDDPVGATVVRYGQSHLYRCGLNDTGSFWANGDYQTILFWLDNSQFDYYVSVEYDVAVGIDIDAVIASMELDNIDSLSEPVPEDIAHWPHLGSCVDFYNFRDIKPSLFCISFFSRAAIAAIYSRRLLQVRQKKILATELFPLGEVVMGSEPSIMGLKERRLVDYCANLNNYRWDRAIPLGMVTEDILEHSIVHPVSSVDKVIRSNLLPYVRTLNTHLISIAETIQHAGFYKKVHDLPDNTDHQRRVINESARQHLDPADYAAFFAPIKISGNITCYQSSLSEFSSDEDESLAVFQVPPTGKYRIHTMAENNPFWGVKFPQPIYVRSLSIFDREDIHRAYIYEISARFQDDMQVVYMSPAPEYLGNIIIGPKIIEVDQKITELRIAIRGNGMIHFDAVQCDLTPTSTSLEAASGA